MDILKQFVEENQLTQANILKYVDAYSIFSFYIGEELELNTKYSSPLRQGDADPSFSMFYSKFKEDKLMFKDQSTGNFGDVFTFVAQMIGGVAEPAYPRETLLQINSDFGLGFGDADVAAFKPHLLKKPPVRKEPITISITTDGATKKDYLNYWDYLDISFETRQYYKCKNPKAVHYIGTDHVTIVPRTLTISYEILGTYKIYHPFEDKKFKFRNNYATGYVEGALQLRFEQDFCIITKSMKEIMFLYEHFGWECVAGPSENSYISDHFMKEVLFKKYKRVYIWLDNDEAGINAQKRYTDLYPWLIPIVFDENIKQKDPTDFYSAGKQLGQQARVLEYIKQLINNYENGSIRTN